MPPLDEQWPAAPPGDDVVVVGMGLVVERAHDTDGLWRLLMKGGTSFRPAPSARWHYPSFQHQDRSAEDKTYQSAAGFLTEPQPAGDQQEMTTRWLREALRQALAGVTVPREGCSVVLGYTPDGSQHLEEASVLSTARAQFATLFDQNMADPHARRAALHAVDRALHRRYWRGASRPGQALPHRVGRNSVSGLLPDGCRVRMVDTACSSSLYALDIGAKDLLRGAAQLAVCGGAFALGPRGSVLFSKLNGLSFAGEVRSLDARADGVLFADGAAVVVLKRRRRAEADGDRILGVLRAFGASSDGRGKAIYAPNPDGQELAVRRAFAAAHPEDLQNLDWVVAHATGTPAGDLAELTALQKVVPAGREVYVTSNKSLLGHTGWAAGVVSLIHVLLALEHQLIPPQHNFEIPLLGEGTPRVRVPRQPVAWKPIAGRARLASVSGFGFGGTNAHLLVSEYRRTETGPPRRPLSSARLAIVAWAAHFPALPGPDAVSAWLEGRGPGPAPSFGPMYPPAPFEQTRMPPTTVRAIDRTQLMVLECGHRLRQLLGPAWDPLRDDTGTFLGHMGPTRNAMLYGDRCYLDDVETTLRSDPEANSLPQLDVVLQARRKLVSGRVGKSNENSFPGMMPNVVAARLANVFGLKGPNMSLDTGFSSALEAVGVASQYLRTGEIELALAGGLTGNSLDGCQELIHDLCPDGAAPLGEGAILFALMREDSARRAGLPLLALLGDTAPSSDALPEDEISCGAHPPTGRLNYLGAEGALGLLQALHRRQPTVAVTCRDERGELACAALVVSQPHLAVNRSSVLPAVSLLDRAGQAASRLFPNLRVAAIEQVVLPPSFTTDDARAGARETNVVVLHRRADYAVVEVSFRRSDADAVAGRPERYHLGARVILAARLPLAPRWAVTGAGRGQGLRFQPRPTQGASASALPLPLIDALVHATGRSRPIRIRRIDFYAPPDSQPGAPLLELSALPGLRAGHISRAVAVAPDGRIALQLKDLEEPLTTGNAHEVSPRDSTAARPGPVLAVDGRQPDRHPHP
jgi:3-oxoacyl-(acyl-carrier-protein) synthase